MQRDTRRNVRSRPPTAVNGREPSRRRSRANSSIAGGEPPLAVRSTTDGSRIRDVRQRQPRVARYVISGGGVDDGQSQRPGVATRDERVIARPALGCAGAITTSRPRLRARTAARARASHAVGPPQGTRSCGGACGSRCRGAPRPMARSPLSRRPPGRRARTERPAHGERGGEGSAIASVSMVMPSMPAATRCSSTWASLRRYSREALCWRPDSARRCTGIPTRAGARHGSPGRRG
jgi:hypothetical protein